MSCADLVGRQGRSRREAAQEPHCIDFAPVEMHNHRLHIDVQPMVCDLNGDQTWSQLPESLTIHIKDSSSLVPTPSTGYADRRRSNSIHGMRFPQRRSSEVTPVSLPGIRSGSLPLFGQSSDIMQSGCWAAVRPLTRLHNDPRTNL